MDGQKIQGEKTRSKLGDFPSLSLNGNELASETINSLGSKWIDKRSKTSSKPFNFFKWK
jgi:hypothetical protein